MTSHPEAPTVGWSDVYRYFIPDTPGRSSHGKWEFDAQTAHGLTIVTGSVHAPECQFRVTRQEDLHPLYCTLDSAEQAIREQACDRFLSLYATHYEDFRELSQVPDGEMGLETDDGATCEVRDTPAGYQCTWSDGYSLTFVWGDVECPCHEHQRAAQIAAHPDLADAVAYIRGSYPNDPELAEAAVKAACDAHGVFTSSERELAHLEDEGRRFALAEARVFGARALEERRG